MRSSILREIYKDNLRMGEKATYKQRRRKRIKLTALGSLFLLTLLIYVLLNHSTFFARTTAQQPGSSFPDTRLIQPDIQLKSKGMSGNKLTPSRYRTFLNEVQTPLRRIFGLKVKKILIDPGHGGEEWGAKGKLGTKEKDITLDIASKLKERLNKHQRYQILMTREMDITLPLEERIGLANSWGADLFISIHINYIPDKPINIIETYYFGPHTDKEALLLAEQENKGSEFTLNDFKEIIQDIGNTLKTQESNSLALFIQKSLYKNISKRNKDIKNWGIKTAPFIVLLGVEAPSVLTEVTCLSAPNEEERLNKEFYREEIARYIEEGIVNYLNKNIDKGEVIWSKRRP